MAKKRLTKADILAVEDRPTEDVPVEAWGGTVTIRALSGAEREEWQLSQVKIVIGADDGLTRVPNLNGATVRLVQASIVDPDTDKLMFTKADVAALGAKSATALDDVLAAALRLNGLTDEAVETEAKNFETTVSSEPGTD